MDETDCVSGFARAWVKSWCSAYEWPPSARFSFAKYGRGPAHQLCREWCRRSEYFYQLWVWAEEDEEDFGYTEAQVLAYEEDMEWLDFMISQEADSPAFIRGMEIRRMKPFMGP